MRTAKLGPISRGYWSAGRHRRSHVRNRPERVPGTEIDGDDPQRGCSTRNLADAYRLHSTLMSAVAAVAPPDRGRPSVARSQGGTAASVTEVQRSGRELGPDLSRIGRRGHAAPLSQIRGFVERVISVRTEGGCTLVTPRRRAHRGLRKNDDELSIQIHGTRAKRTPGYCQGQICRDHPIAILLMACATVPDSAERFAPSTSSPAGTLTRLRGATGGAMRRACAMDRSRLMCDFGARSGTLVKRSRTAAVGHAQDYTGGTERIHYALGSTYGRRIRITHSPLNKD